MRTVLPYGRSSVEVTVPDSAAVLETRQISTLANERESLLGALSDPIDSPPLREIVRRDDTVAIVISDITRPTPNHRLIPCILEELDDHPRDRLVIINGTGSHRPNTDGELAAMLGDEIFGSVRVVNHSAFDKTTLEHLGSSASGADVYLNRDYCTADVRIVTGFIEPHFFAGFSGGPKGIMPGIAGIDTIMHLHSAPLIGHPESTFGVLDGNPVQREVTEIALMCKPDFAVNVTLNDQGGITGVFAGDVIAAHRRGSGLVREQSMIACNSPYDVVITTNGGYPLDQNLYQTVKGMCAARQIVREGGDIVCASECSEGLPDHGNFAEILGMGDTPREILEMIEGAEFSMYDQWEAQKMAMIQVWATVHLYSALPRGAVIEAHLEPVNTIEATLEQLQSKHGSRAEMAVLPQGPQTIPYIDAGYDGGRK